MPSVRVVSSSASALLRRQGAHLGQLAAAIARGDADAARRAQSALNFFSADPNALLDARFALANQPFLSQAGERYRRATSAPDAAARITGIIQGAPGTEPLIAIRQRFTAAGTAIYRTGVVPGTVSIYRGWNQDQYDRLLTWASYAVM